MSKIKNIIIELFKYTAYSFTISIMVFLIIGVFVGIKGMSTSMIMELLFICGFASLLQIIIFSDSFLKQLNYVKKLVIFLITFLIFITTFAIKFDWFNIDNYNSWIIFIIIFIICSILISGLFELYFKFIGDKYTGILNEYKKNKK